MKYSYSVKEIREADEATIGSGVPSITLMERAGRALADVVRNAMESTGISEALFVCGGGNNGGDGFCAAQIIQESGKQATVLCLAEKFSADCATMKQRYRGTVFGRIPRARYGLIVDCLFGTGLTRAPEGKDARLIDFINSCGAYVIACDMPSGLQASGVAFPSCVKASETLTMGGLKHALLLSDGADVCGQISIADIGITLPRTRASIYENNDIARFFPKKRSNTHKGSYGSACIIAGDMYSGAAFLSAGACLKSGAGYTRLLVSPALYPYAVGKLPACILKEFTQDGDALSSDCIAFGMGMGVNSGVYKTTSELLFDYRGVLVLDADALNALARYGGVSLLKEKACRVVITPHVKEFSRLTGKSIDEIWSDPVSLAEEFAREYGVTVLLKSNRSVITDGERTSINVSGSPVLAKGGSGDVLSGFLAGTVARGIAPYESACIASYLVGKAGELSAQELGEYASDASDIIEFLPKVMRNIVI